MQAPASDSGRSRFAALATSPRPQARGGQGASFTAVVICYGRSMTYVPPDHGFRTFIIVWAAQSLSVIGSGMTGFALNVYLAQVLYPAPE